MSYDLGTIRQNAPIDTALADYVPAAGDPAAAAALMTRLELFKLMERLHIAPGAVAAKTEAGAGAEALPVHEYRDGAAVLAQCEDRGEAYFLPKWDGDALEKALHLRQIRRRGGDRRGPGGRRVSARLPVEQGD